MGSFEDYCLKQASVFLLVWEGLGTDDVWDECIKYKQTQNTATVLDSAGNN